MRTMIHGTSLSNLAGACALALLMLSACATPKPSATYSIQRARPLAPAPTTFQGQPLEIGPAMTVFGDGPRDVQLHDPQIGADPCMERTFAGSPDHWPSPPPSLRPCWRPFLDVTLSSEPEKGSRY